MNKQHLKKNNSKLKNIRHCDNKIYEKINTCMTLLAEIALEVKEIYEEIE